MLLDYSRAASISGSDNACSGFPAGHSHRVPGKATEQGFCKQIHISFDRANIWLWISGQSLFHSCYQKKPYMLSGSTAMQCKEFNSWKYIATMVCYRTNFRSWFPANIKFYRSCQGQHCSEFSAIRYWADLLITFTLTFSILFKCFHIHCM